MPATSAGRWDQSDLVRRVINALDVANRTVRTLIEADSVNVGGATAKKGADVLMRDKVIAETAMLLLCAEPICSLDDRIREKLGVIAALLVPYARHEDVRGAICLDPGRARDHAVAHALLSRLGYPDPDVDHLLSESLALGADFGPERLPHRQLEQEWLARVWSVGEPLKHRDSQILANSMLGRPLDALGASRFDIYAFTHAMMYVSDLGRRRIALPRPSAAIGADAVAALAFSLDSNDFDLTAEVLMTWPMLALTWSPPAIFAFRLLASVEDDLGFLPGIKFDFARYQALKGDDRSRYALMTSYHTAYVMGFLCSVALRHSCAPHAVVPSARRSPGGGAAILRFVKADGPKPCWTEPFAALAPHQQDSVAPLVLATLLRRARAEGSLGLVRELLKVALAHDLIDGPAPRQAAALLRRSQALKLEGLARPGAG